MIVVLRLRSSHAMEALRHEHEHDLLEVGGIAVWILNILVDATRHHAKTETADQTAAWWSFREGNGREGQRMATG